MKGFRCTALGLIAALYVLAGRWGFYRLSPGGSDASAVLEPRMWLVMGGFLLATVGLAHAAWRRPEPGETRPDAGLGAAVLAFFVYMGASASWAPDSPLVGWKLYEVILSAIMCLGFGIAALRQPAEHVLESFWGGIVAATGLLALVGLRTFLGGGGGERLAVMGGGPNVFARLMGLLALGALYFWRRGGATWLWIPAAAIGVLLSVLTGSRGGALSIIAAVLAFLALGRIPLRRLVLLALLAIVATSGVVAFTPLGKALSHSMEERFLKLTLKYQGGDSAGGGVYLSGREVLYARAIALGRDRPLMGAGLAAFPALGLGPYPHNMFLEIFCEGGVLGLMFLVGVFLAYARVAFRGRRSLDAATVGAVVLVLVGSQSSGDLYDARSLFLLMVLSACTSAAGTVPVRFEPKASVTSEGGT
ncbi:O-antigen ligase family protein [Pyxidicoccus parkwayensis]|uniref:O-antigen ligase family protein n=1 Tax=Pyxidicoccus parkwayensis TaxID=2813578 RepID=A0ABX7P2S8_9BACT|nr:O-antigen ligase family protein [Pyxidicoccus parkwaysis]QSQ24767.1 O-antigen ligase family protein [Pyxidicoccus parkwaysis]